VRLDPVPGTGQHGARADVVVGVPEAVHVGRLEAAHLEPGAVLLGDETAGCIAFAPARLARQSLGLQVAPRGGVRRQRTQRAVALDQPPCVKLLVALIGLPTRGDRRREMARYGQQFKDRVIARLLPPESSAVEKVSHEIGISVSTLERCNRPFGDVLQSLGLKAEDVPISGDE